MKHRLHVVGLPHTQTTLAYSSCAYTEKVRKFCRMMHERGHEVLLYSGVDNEAPCMEHVPCISEGARKRIVGSDHYTTASFTGLHWDTFNGEVITQIQRRIQPRDFICLIAGIAQKPIADAFPHHISVEFGIGYGGTFAKFRVWESYAWMHTCYGAKTQSTPHELDGFWYDAVIPGYLEPERFQFQSVKEDYFLFLGRIIPRKGIGIAVDACRRAGKRLVVAGIGEAPVGADYLGEVGPEKRAALLAGAQALFAPTIYIEPFGNVVPEAMVSGTPVITSDWGAFTESNVQGVTGFRCRTLPEFIDAMEQVKKLDPRVIRNHALKRYSIGVVGKQYQDYFDRLGSLWDQNWDGSPVQPHLR